MTAALLEFALNLIDKIGYLGVFFILVVDNAGVPIPSEATLALAGNLSRGGVFNIFLVILLGTLAQTLGTAAAYWIGKTGGEPLVKKYGKYVFISSHDYDKAHKWFEKRGEQAIFVSRLTPVIRTFAGFAAGTFEMNFTKFLRDSALGSLVWTIVFATLGYLLGDSWRHYYEYMHYLDYIILLGIAVVLARYILKKVRGRHA